MTTFLPCQKRHHEPHYVTVPDVGFGVWGDKYCNGKPRWPHTRPKPPRLHDHDRSIAYCIEHDAIIVFKDSYGPLWTAYLPGDNGYRHFFTHAEAINYAQKLAQERSKQRGK